MKIPNKIKILDQVIRVKWDDEHCEQHQAVGVTEFDFNNLILCGRYNKRRLPKSRIERTFFHELAHFMVYFTGYRALAQNEKFIDQLGMILYNVLLNNNFKEEQKNESKQNEP